MAVKLLRNTLKIDSRKRFLNFENLTVLAITFIPRKILSAVQMWS